MIRELKTRAELEEIVMAEIRKHPACRDVASVAIVQPTDRNWDAAFVMLTPPGAPTEAFEIARVLQARFDLAA